MQVRPSVLCSFEHILGGMTTTKKLLAVIRGDHAKENFSVVNITDTHWSSGVIGYTRVSIMLLATHPVSNALLSCCGLSGVFETSQSFLLLEGSNCHPKAPTCQEPSGKARFSHNQKRREGGICVA